MATYDYTVFGKRRRECLRQSQVFACDGTASNPARTNTWKFVGQRADLDTGLGHHGARYYDPSIGRFTQPDTLGSAGGGVKCPLPTPPTIRRVWRQCAGKCRDPIMHQSA